MNSKIKCNPNCKDPLHRHCRKCDNACLRGEYLCYDCRNLEVAEAIQTLSKAGYVVSKVTLKREDHNPIIIIPRKGHEQDYKP